MAYFYSLFFITHNFAKKAKHLFVFQNNWSQTGWPCSWMVFLANFPSLLPREQFVGGQEATKWRLLAVTVSRKSIDGKIEPSNTGQRPFFPAT